MSANPNFSRIITMLRKERGISQKNAADALGVSQALLSHYEKGIRECGLDFLVKISDYYNVSCDYLLGRSPEINGKTITYDDLPEEDLTKKERVLPSEMMLNFNKKLIMSGINIIFTLIGKTGSATLMKEAANYLMIAIYKLFRIIHVSNPKNDPRFFEIPAEAALSLSSGAMLSCEGNCLAAAKGIAYSGHDTAKANPDTEITSTSLGNLFPATSTALLNIVKNSESRMQMITNSVR
jgi:transcriptional regulator with XRE-family HTH domain